ncbi:MAG TPA: hypothetical protein VGR55_07510 [Candidatus Acidoferrum sp.]|nr:hypothetical protein [Candidatus Acidoferrum sp.]
MPTGATLSNHLMDQGEATFPGDYRTPAARVSTKARVLIALFVLLLLSAVYLWFFGPQTVAAIGARYYITRKAPVVSMAPAQLTDLSISRSPGKKLSYFGYEFEVPWSDMDNSKSKMIGDNKELIAFQSGNTLSVWHGSPRAFVNSVLSNDKIDPSTIRRIYGDEALSSDSAFYRTLLETTPEKITPFMPRQDAVGRAFLLIVKGIILPRGTQSGIFAVTAGEFSGFQFGRPQNQSGEVSVRLFSATGSLNFIFVHPAGGPTVISQPDINRILQTLHKSASPPIAKP